MSLNPHQYRGLKFVLHGLSAVVFVECACSSAKGVLGVLEVVVLHVLDETRAHVLVVGAGAEGWGQLRACFLMQVGAKGPAGSEDQQEVAEEQGVALFCVLDPSRVHVHVVLW